MAKTTKPETIKQAVARLVELAFDERDEIRAKLGDMNQILVHILKRLPPSSGNGNGNHK